MAKYIELDALVAEIENKINKIDLNSIEDWRYRIQREHDIEVMKNIISIINTLEVKEVDLDKELDSMITPELKFHKALPSLFDVAKHFFELGMSVSNKTQKGE